MSAAGKRRQNGGGDRAQDRAALRLLLEDDVETEVEAHAEVAEVPQKRSGVAFFVTVVIALAIAAGSWMVAMALARTASTEQSGILAQEEVQSTDLLFELREDGMPSGELRDRLRQAVGSHAGHLQTDSDGRVVVIEVGAARVRALMEALEGQGLGVLNSTEDTSVPPEVARGSEWEQWSDRLRIRRALRRAERQGGTIAVGVQESG